jgi:dihydrofolate reductase
VILSLIAAVAANGVIGEGGRLPWRLPADLRRFKEITWGHPVIMGRKTFESMGKPLGGRRNLVLSSRRDFAPAGVDLVASLEEALARCAGEPEVFVIGGASLYREALPRAQRFYLTRVEADISGEVTFPEWDPSGWRLVEDEARAPDASNPYPLRFQVYARP